MRAEVSELIGAPPERVYELVSDLPRMGEWSPECVRCVWRDGATQARPGARFTGYNRRGVRRWSTTGTVVEAEAPRRLVFDVTSVFGLPVSRWSYEIAADEGGSVVRETWEDRRGGLMKVLGLLASGIGDRVGHNAEGMQRTLARIKEAAEAR